MSYIGIPPFGQTVRTVTTFTATASQTTFTPNGGYTVGYIDVYYNGIRLVGGTDYSASNGSTVVLTTGATANAVIEVVAYGSVSLADSVRRSGDTFSGAVLFPNNVIHAANGNVGIGNTIPNAPLVVGSASGSFTNPLIQAAGNANSWIQINGQNLNNGNNASTDLVLSRSDGNDTAGYIDVGVNSNTYNQAAYSLMTPNSGYVFTNGGDLFLGTQTAHGVTIHTGNTTTGSARLIVAAAGDIQVGGTDNTKNIQLLYGGGGGSYQAINHPTGAGDGYSYLIFNYNGTRIGEISQAGTSSVTYNTAGAQGSRTGTNLIQAGVQFPPSQVASSDGNTLDDYEEGTWTPTVSFGGSSAGITYSAQVGRYVKVGKLVTFNFYCRLSSKGSATGALTIGGLPFTSENIGNGYNAHTLWINGTNSSLAGVIQGYVSGNANWITWERFGSGFYGSLASVNNSDVGTTSDFMSGGSYFTT